MGAPDNFLILETEASYEKSQASNQDFEHVIWAVEPVKSKWLNMGIKLKRNWSKCGYWLSSCSPRLIGKSTHEGCAEPRTLGPVGSYLDDLNRGLSGCAVCVTQEELLNLSGIQFL